MSTYVSVTGQLVDANQPDLSITSGLNGLALGRPGDSDTGVSGILSGSFDNDWTSATNLHLSGNTDSPPAPYGLDSLWSSGAGTAQAAPGTAETVPIEQTSIGSAITGIGRYGASIASAIFSPLTTGSTTSPTRPNQPVVPGAQPIGITSSPQLLVLLVVLALTAVLLIHGWKE